MNKFVNPETIAKMQSDIKKKAGLNTNNTFKGNNNFEKAPTINGEEIATVTTNGTNYLMVYGVGTPTENAAELQAAYEEAKKMPRYLGAMTINTELNYYKGQTLYNNDDNTYLRIIEDFIGSFEGISPITEQITESEAKSTRTTVIVAPGEYDFGDSAFIADASGIDIVSLTGNADVLLDGIIVGANNVYIKGIDCGVDPFTLTSEYPDNIYENCKSLADEVFTSGSGSVINVGTFINCTGGAAAFGGQGRFAGKMFNCNVVSTEGPAGDYWIEMTGLVQNCSFSHGILNATGVGKIINCITSDGSIYNSVNVSVPDGVDAGDAVNKGQLDTKAVINNTELLGSTSIQKLAIGIGNINPSGTISSITNGVVTGNGTKFTTEFYAGAKIYFPSISGGAPQTISAITDDSTLRITNTSASVPPDSSYHGDLERALNVGYVILEFADNAAAVTGGLANGDIYRTADVLKVVHA